MFDTLDALVEKDLFVEERLLLHPLPWNVSQNVTHLGQLRPPVGYTCDSMCFLIETTDLLSELGALR